MNTKANSALDIAKISAGMRQDLLLLLALGRRLEFRLRGRSVREVLIAALLRVRDKQGRLVPLRANRAQREYERRRGRRNIVLKARQMGITTWIAAGFFIATITRAGTMSVLVAHDQRAAEEIFRIVHRFWENLPRALREGVLRRGRANVRQITFPALDSEYRVESAHDADAGRGLTIRHLHCSEVARWPRDAAGTLAALRAAVPPRGEVALESTPSGAAGCFYDEWQRASRNGEAAQNAVAVAHFFPWWYEPAYVAVAASKPLSDEECRLIAAHGLTHEQIGFRRELRQSFGRLAPQEFAEDAERCFLASGDCVFDLEAIEARMEECGSPVSRTRFVDHYAPPLQGREYIIGVDTAGGGTAGDFACAQVIDRASGMQCAELHAHLPPDELARELAALAQEYNQAMLAVERNNHGHAVLALLLGLHRYANVYEQRGVAGWNTNASTRPRMIAGVNAHLTAKPQAIQSRALLREMRSFVRHADGRQAAAAGAHDDRVMALAVALGVRDEAA